MKKLNYPLDISHARLLTNHNYVFIDIETDGLSHKNRLAIIGLLFISSKSPTGELIQLFNDDYNSEKEMLEALFLLLREHDIDHFISFNGDSFDFPFLIARLNHYKMKYKLNKLLNLDLLKVVRRNRSQLQLTNARLKDVELMLGINRNDVISGKDSIVLYHAYLETKDERLMQTILLHNYDDIVNMIPLLNLFDHTEESFESLLPPHKTVGGTKWYLWKLDLRKDHITYFYTAHNSISQLDQYHESIGLTYIKEGCNITIKVLLKNYDKNMLTMIDLEHVFKRHPSLFSDAEKQMYVIQYKDLLYKDNVQRFGWEILQYVSEKL